MLLFYSTTRDCSNSAENMEGKEYSQTSILSTNSAYKTINIVQI